MGSVLNNFSIHNNRDVAERLRRWIHKIVSLPCEGSNPTMNKIFFVMFTCSVPPPPPPNLSPRASLYRRNSACRKGPKLCDCSPPPPKSKFYSGYEENRAV